MACSIQKQPAPTADNAGAVTATPTRSPLQPQQQHQQQQQQQQQPQQQQQQQQQYTITPRPGNKQRSSLPSDALQAPLRDMPWPPTPVSTHTSNLRLNMMNQNPKDLHTARLIIEELRSKVRYQTEHIMKWRKAYAMQIQQHYRYQKEKTDQMNALTSQLLLLESRLKRKQKQISSLLNHREITIHRQQKIIDTLSSRLVDHGLETIEASYATELDSLNDSDSAVVLEDIDSDSNMTLGSGGRRRSSGSGPCGDGISIARSISDAIETNLNKYGGVRRANCYLRRPEILETVYSVEETEEPTTDVAEKRDKFRNRSDKALSSSSTEGQIDGPATIASASATATTNPSISVTITAAEDVREQTKESTYGNVGRSYIHSGMSPPKRQHSSPTPLQHSSPVKDGHTAYSVRVPQLQRGAEDVPVKTQVTNFNRVMSNHRSVTKPKDVKYKRINKAKSKSLEELRGRLKNLVERGTEGGAVPNSNGGGYPHGMMPQTAQSYA